MSIEFRKEFIADMDEALVASNPFTSLFNANPNILSWLQKAEEVKVEKPQEAEKPAPKKAPKKISKP